MHIGIIGKGRIGAALQAGWTRAGHVVQTGSRSTKRSPLKIAGWANVIVLAVPYATIGEAATSIAPTTGKTIIDCTNPIAMGPDGMELAVGHTNSGAEKLQKLLPNAKIVKTLNQAIIQKKGRDWAFGAMPRETEA